MLLPRTCPCYYITNAEFGETGSCHVRTSYCLNLRQIHEPITTIRNTITSYYDDNSITP